MFGKKKNKEDNRYYLLPGMGKANRQKHRHYFLWSLLVGIIFSLIFAGILYYMHASRYR